MKNLYLILIVTLGITSCGSDTQTNKRILELEQTNKQLLKIQMALESNRSASINKDTLKYNHSEKLASIQAKKEIAKIQSSKEVEALKLKNELDIKRIADKKELESKRISQQKELLILENELSTKRYLIALVALISLIISFFIYIYFKHRRENKLIAYNDNLEKYFRSKETDAKVKIAQKILDTVSSGNLSKEHESKLIEVLNSNDIEKTKNIKPIDKNEETKALEAEII